MKDHDRVPGRLWADCGTYLGSQRGNELLELSDVACVEGVEEVLDRLVLGPDERVKDWVLKLCTSKECCKRPSVVSDAIGCLRVLQSCKSCRAVPTARGRAPAEHAQSPTNPCPRSRTPGTTTSSCSSQQTRPWPVPRSNNQVSTSFAAGPRPTSRRVGAHLVVVTRDAVEASVNDEVYRVELVEDVLRCVDG